MAQSTLHVCGRCGGFVPGWGTLCDPCKAQAEKVRAELQVLADRRLEFRIKQQARERQERRGEWREACDEPGTPPALDAGARVYHVEYYTLSDSHTSTNVRAMSEDAARAQVYAGGECDSICSVSVRS